MQFYTIANEYTCWGTIDSDGCVLKLKVRGVGLRDFEDGGCDGEVE